MYYHYTKIEYLISILNNKEFWLNNISNMKDKTEGTFGILYLESKIAKSVSKSDDILKLKKTISSLLADDDKYVSKFEQVLTTPIYIMSFSKNSNNDYLWGNSYPDIYNKKVCMEVDINKLFEKLDKDFLKHGGKNIGIMECKLEGEIIFKRDVFYENDKRIIPWFSRFYSLARTAGLNEDNSLLLLYELTRSCIKRKCYKKEEEFRILINDDYKSGNIVKDLFMEQNEAYLKSKGLFKPEISLMDNVPRYKLKLDGIIDDNIITKIIVNEYMDEKTIGRIRETLDLNGFINTKIEVRTNNN